MAGLPTRIVYNFLILSIVVITMSTARPQNPIESQPESADYQPNLAELRSYYSYPSPVIVDSAPLDRLQMLIGQAKSASGSSWGDNLYRMPESKRQVRYRQCYFNPISCFRK